MCTAVTYKTKDHYFGRNLDLEYSYEETVTITPRNFPFDFRKMRRMENHYAIIGMAYVAEGYPLYYDGTNEKGLSMAGLNFPQSAHYFVENTPDKANISPFELIPWVLGQCATLSQVRQLLTETTLIRQNFSPTLPVTPLHCLAADTSGSLVIEPVAEGLRLHENPTNVLTNSPRFELQLAHLERARSTSTLPGDSSSISRFIRAADLLRHTDGGDPVTELFHLLDAVAMVQGHTGEAITRYTACCDTASLTYYYSTYENRRITTVRLRPEYLEAGKLISYPLRHKRDILTEA